VEVFIINAMVAFAMEWGWWAVPAAAAVCAGLHYWYAKANGFRRSAPGEFLTVDEVRDLLNRGERLSIVDVRSESAYAASATTARGAVRLNPAHVLEEARRLDLPVGARIVAFCA